MMFREAEGVFLPLGDDDRDVLDLEQDGVVLARYCGPLCSAIPFRCSSRHLSVETSLLGSWFRRRVRCRGEAADVQRDLVEELDVGRRCCRGQSSVQERKRLDRGPDAYLLPIEWRSGYQDGLEMPAPDFFGPASGWVRKPY